jgi:hypothetical protein
MGIVYFIIDQLPTRRVRLPTDGATDVVSYLRAMHACVVCTHDSIQLRACGGWNRGEKCNTELNTYTCK